MLVPNGGTPEDRFDDYTPTRPANVKAGGKADAYGRMLVEELKPFIDSEYRTLTDAANTGLGGASLGGLVSLHLGLRHPMVFGKLAVMSPSVWWDNKEDQTHGANLARYRHPGAIWIGARCPGAARCAREEGVDAER